MAASSATIPSSVPHLGLLVLQPTPFCNIDCSYCYLPNRNVKARMSLETLALVCKHVLRGTDLGPTLDVAWHAGEPLVVPAEWYGEATALMAERAPGGVRIQHCFQTNGLLIDEGWVALFARIGARIGLSIDGPADLHDANRRTRGGQGTFDRAMRGARLMQESGYSFHVITVLTERSLEEPDRLFDFYVENGITEVGFNVEEIEGDHVTSSMQGSTVEAKYRRFLRRFFERVWTSHGLLKVREFDDALGTILSDEAVRDEQNIPFRIISVAYDGALSTFSPELLDARHARFGRFAFGHVGTGRLADIETSALFQDVSGEIKRGVDACERECRYFRWCGGGAPANKLFETGTFAASETMHCRLTRQAVLDEVLGGIELQARCGLKEAQL